MHNLKKTIFINIFSNNAGHFFQALLGFILIPFLIKKLGVEGYGTIVLAESLIVFFELGAAGIRNGLGRYLGISLAKNNILETNKYLSAGKKILTYINIGLFTFGIIIILLFEKIFNIPAQIKNEIKIFMIFMVSAFLMQVFFIPFWAILYSKQKFYLLNFYTSIRNIIRIILCFAVYTIFDPHIYYYGIIYLTSLFTEQFLAYKESKKLFPHLNLKTKYEKEKTKDLLSFTTYKTIDYISGILYTNTDMILINIFFGGTAYNTIYSISLKFGEIIKRFIQRSLWVLVPSFTELHGKNENELLHKIFISTTKTTAILIMPIFFGLLIFGKDALTLWVGKKLLSALYPMYINLFAIIPLLIFTPASGVLTAYGKIKLTSISSLILAIFNVFISIFLAIYLKMGLNGFALGTLISYYLQFGIIIPLYTCKTINTNSKPLFTNSFVKPLFFGLVILYPFNFFKSKVQNLPLNIILFILLWFIYFFLTYKFLLNKEEKQFTRKLFLKTFKK